MHKRELSRITLATVSNVPLFYGASDLGKAAFLSGSVLLAIFIFEVVFHLTKRFWLHSVRPLFALIILASVLSGIYLISRAFLWEGRAATLQFFPLTLVSAFLLSCGTTAMNESFGSRIGTRAGFSILLLIVGVARRWGGTFQSFPPGPFWVSAFALSIFFFWNKKRAK